MALERTHARIRSRRAVWAVARKRVIVNQTATPPNQEIALGNYEDGDISRVEPRGFEPLTSAVQKRIISLLEVSGACKTAANIRIF
jgi:hypothetical protein